jgi:RNA polymerase sigma factor (sigma-70 family)
VQWLNARAWVLTIVRNTAYSWLAKNRTPDFVAFQTVLDEEQHLAAQYGGEGFGTSTSSPEAALIAKVAMGHLEAAIAALPVEFREVLILRDVQGLEYREIAQITSLPVGTVMSRLARARRRLIDAIRTDDVLAYREPGRRRGRSTGSLPADLRQAVSELPRRTLPPHLRSRIDAAFGSKRQPARSSWQALAASTLLAFMLGGGSTWLVLHPVASERTTEAVVDSHMRGLMASHPTDVASSERHTVKPWFNGRIPQAPRVVDLAQDGFPLIGARVDVIGNTPVPTLVYGRRLHVISLSAVPEPGQGDEIKVHRSINGYNVVSWREGGIGYWAISDLSVEELNTFSRLFMSSPS